MSSPLPPISAVIPNRDGAALLPRILPPLLAELPPDQHEVVVVDDASEDSSLDLLAREFPSVRVVELKPNVGFGAACNRGFDEVRHDLVLLLNSDMEVTPGSVPVLAQHFVEADVFAVAPRYVSPGAPTAAEAPDGRPFGHQICAPAGGGLFRRDAFRSLGGFDPLYHPFYWEDMDLGWTAWAAGWRIVHDPRCHFVHLENATIRRLYPGSYVRRIRARNRLLFGWKNLRSLGRLAPFLARTAAGAVGDLLLRADPARFLGVCASLARLPSCLARRFRAGPGLPDREIIERSECVWELLLKL